LPWKSSFIRHSAVAHLLVALWIAPAHRATSAPGPSPLSAPRRSPHLPRTARAAKQTPAVDGACKVKQTLLERDVPRQAVRAVRRRRAVLRVPTRMPLPRSPVNECHWAERSCTAAAATQECVRAAAARGGARARTRRRQGAQGQQPAEREGRRTVARPLGRHRGAGRAVRAPRRPRPQPRAVRPARSEWSRRYSRAVRAASALV
jgi:hypothetical protein